MTKLNLRAIVLVLLPVLIMASCKKENSGTSEPSSIRIIPTTNEPNQVNMTASPGGVLLAWVTSGDLVVPAVRQELFLLNANGDILKTIHLSDTVFQFIAAVKGINGGFFVCATSNSFPYIATYQVSDGGEVMWSKTFPVKFGTNKNQPALITGRDNNYMVMYQSVGSGYYVWKGDASGNEIFNTKFPTPNAIHYGTGLNYGEKYVNFAQVNDTLITVQGITYDEYDDLIENCFVRTVDEQVKKEWYSTNYDSSHMEAGAGFAYVNNKIMLFGSKALNKYYESAGDVFVRKYSTTGTYEGETLYPRTNGTPTRVNRVINLNGGGILLIGFNNQYGQVGVVSPNQVVITRLNHNAGYLWSRTIDCYYPAKGYDAVIHHDGTIGLIGLIKDRFKDNNLMYLKLDASGNIIKN